MKLIIQIIKLFPLLTLAYGFIKGGTRINPVIDTARVALTQYELAQISQIVVRSLDEKQAPHLMPEEFPTFLKDQFYNQYSVLARELSGERDHNLALDIWGRPFKIHFDTRMSNIRIMSAGPDTQFETKDDIASEIALETNVPVKSMARAAQEAEPDIREEVVVNAEPDEATSEVDDRSDVQDESQLSEEYTHSEENESNLEERTPANEEDGKTYHDENEYVEETNELK